MPIFQKVLIIPLLKAYCLVMKHTLICDLIRLVVRKYQEYSVFYKKENAL